MSMDVEKLLSQIETTPTSASARMVFGEPIKVGDRTIVPVARVGGGFGLGFGGKRTLPETGEAAAEQASRGGGGGGRLSARPVAVIEVSPEKVRVKPIVDVTRIVLSGMLLAAWSVFWITSTIKAVHRSRRST